MNRNAQLYKQKMEDEGYKGLTVDQRENGDDVQYSINLNCGASVVIHAFFNNDLRYATVRTFYIKGVPDDRYAQILLACNEANSDYKWVKMYIDSDNDVAAELDAIVSEDTVADKLYQLIGYVHSIINQVYPKMMKAIYGDDGSYEK